MSDDIAISTHPIKTYDEAKASLRASIEFIDLAIQIGNEIGTSKVAIVSNFLDGGGKVVAQFDAEFVDDLKIVLEQ